MNGPVTMGEPFARARPQSAGPVGERPAVHGTHGIPFHPAQYCLGGRTAVKGRTPQCCRERNLQANDMGLQETATSSFPMFTGGGTQRSNTLPARRSPLPPKAPAALLTGRQNVHDTEARLGTPATEFTARAIRRIIVVPLVVPAIPSLCLPIRFSMHIDHRIDASGTRLAEPRRRVRRHSPPVAA
jgi:hypothetical protein